MPHGPRGRWAGDVQSKRLLSLEERRAAVVLSRALNAAKAAFETGDNDAGHLRQVMVDVINGEPLARMQYVSCADPSNLEELEGAVTRALLSMAVKIGKTRLIDNLLIEVS